LLVLEQWGKVRTVVLEIQIVTLAVVVGDLVLLVWVAQALRVLAVLVC
jgi:hypothetical protein